MKKHAVILTLSFLIALYVCGNAFAATSSLLEGSAVRESGGVSVTCWYETVADAENVRDILCAVYDKAGALLALDALDPERETQTALISCPAAQADCVKLFAMDADRRPVGCARVLSVDATPPVFLTPMTVDQRLSTSIRFKCAVNEDCDIYWVAVLAGADYPLSPAESGIITPEYAQEHISSGLNGVRSGSVTARANAATAVNVTGLQAETSYDIWYIAKNLAGTYSAYPTGDPYNPADPNNPKRVCMVTANTLDNTPPVAAQEFTRTPKNSPHYPYSYSDIRIVFNEGVQQASTNLRFIDLYWNVLLAQSSAERGAAKDSLADALRATIKLYNNANPALPALVAERNSANASENSNWAIDYRNCAVTMEGARTVVTFPTFIETDGRQISALRLDDGADYYFQIEDVSDASFERNRMPMTRLAPFRTISLWTAPTFASKTPVLTASKTSVEMRLRLSEPGTVFYAIAPVGAVPTRDLDGRVVDWTVKEIPTAGSDILLDSQGNEIRDEYGNSISLAPFYVLVPSYLAIISPQYASADMKTGYADVAESAVTVTADGLSPGTDYFVYFVLRGVESYFGDDEQNYSQYAQIFRFSTLAATE